MVRRKLEMKQIENRSSRQATYSKRREGLIKKATELSVLCDTDVGLLMFSPNGRLTNFGTGPNGRCENALLRYLDSEEDSRSTLENEEYFYDKINEMKNEGEMLDMIVKIEALEKNLEDVNSKKKKVETRLKCYNFDEEKINTILEADVYHNFLTGSLREVQQMKAEMLTDIAESSSSNSRKNRLNLEPLEDENEGDKNFGPHLSLDYLLKKASDGKLQIGIDKSNFNNVNNMVVGEGNVYGNGNNNGNGSGNGSANINHSG